MVDGVKWSTFSMNILATLIFMNTFFNIYIYLKNIYMYKGNKWVYIPLMMGKYDIIYYIL